MRIDYKLSQAGKRSCPSCGASMGVSDILIYGGVCSDCEMIRSEIPDLLTIETEKSCHFEAITSSQNSTEILHAMRQNPPESRTPLNIKINLRHK